MKRLILASIAAITAAAAWAQPLLVGHRGSYYGVENTAESFINGAKRGYQYLETDIKVTKDNKYVCSHNDDFTAVGGTLTIASSTLDAILAQDLSQTRGGVKYTGHPCSLEQYLDICTEYNVKPLMELKWATGINSNDCSGIPALIRFIESKGWRKGCIILTSMKPCLEYIRTHYPDIELQFLTGQYWANHFDWCVDWKIDVNIQAGYFDKACVTKYHDAGLKVNMWTTNTAEGYRQYGNMGCDFITTDYLDPNNLPELDVTVTFPPNTVDFPNREGNIKGAYDFEQVATFDIPAALNGLSVKRAIVRDNKWVVLAHDASKTAHIFVINPETGTVESEVNTSGISGGELAISDIAFSADGVLLACNKAVVPFAGGGDVWKVYKWDSLSGAPSEFLTIDTADRLGNWTNACAGHTMAVSGRLNDLLIYTVSASGTTGSTYRVCGVKAPGTEVADCPYAFNNDVYNETVWGKDFLISVTPSSRNNIVVQSPSMQAEEFTFLWSGTRIPMEQYATIKSAVSNSEATGLSFLRHGQKVYAVAAASQADRSKMTARMYDATDGIDKLASVSSTLDPDFTAACGGHMNAAIAADGSKINVYMFSENVGMAKYSVDLDAKEEVSEIDCQMDLVWINSNTTGNAPQHIDGTNAQQGTGVNGLFYINDCVDKKIYIFDQNGCIGSIPGGSGWGCARDDAGNIIVRDDKLTGNTHSFIIYAAGATPTSYSEPVRLDNVTVPLDGQTNFINASGDLLNGTGRIYLFSNKQTKASVITVEKGIVTDAKASGDLMTTATTAGYVIPINNDPENWIYQVRGVGLYFYSGGTSSELSTARASTTAPARNSTGGGALFKIRGNEIFAHNSGTNYKGGFTLRNRTKDIVVKTVDPIGTLGYETGGNYSTFNWLIPEKIDDSSYYLYQYCPANGMAVYRVYDKLTDGVQSVVVDKSADKVVANVNGNVLSLRAAQDINKVAVYSISGALVLTADTADVNIAALPHGVYVVKVNNSLSAKFVK